MRNKNAATRGRTGHAAEAMSLRRALFYPNPKCPENQIVRVLTELQAIGGRLAVSDRKLWAGAPGGLPDRIRFDLIRLEAPLLDYVTRAGGLWPGDIL